MILNHIKESPKPKKGIYTKQKGLKSENTEPLSSEDVSSIFADVHVGDIVRGQKCYTTGEPNGKKFNGKVTNKDFDGKVNWTEIGDTKLYDTDTFCQLNYHKRVGDATKE